MFILFLHYYTIVDVFESYIEKQSCVSTIWALKFPDLCTELSMAKKVFRTQALVSYMGHP